MYYLRQSTASQEVFIGPFMDPVAPNTEETALTINNTDIKIFKAGATNYVAKNSGGATHVNSGIYLITLDATDTNTIGSGFIYVHVSGALSVKTQFTVLSQAVYDVLFGSAAISTSTDESIASAVWDETITAATHNIATSAGRRLREISSSVILSGIASSSTINTITFNGEASTVDGAYDPGIIYIVNGTGSGQSRLILEYNGSTKTAAVDRDWKVQPDGTSEYVITSSEGREHVNEGLAQGGSSTSITLNTSASSLDDAYSGQVVFIRSGEGEDQARRVTTYNGTTKVANVERAWGTTPDATSAYVMLPSSILPPGMAANDMLDAIVEGSLTFGEWVKLVSAVLFGHSSGSPSGPVVFRDLADTKARVTATVDDDGNRSEVTIDGS